LTTEPRIGRPPAQTMATTPVGSAQPTEHVPGGMSLLPMHAVVATAAAAAAPVEEAAVAPVPDSARTDFVIDDFSPRVGPEGRPISNGMIMRANKQFRQKQQTKKAFLATITHLHLQGKMIHSITNLGICPNLQVVYLYENMITSTEGLEDAPNLTHLYLQHNKVRSVTNLPSTLTKLFLDSNHMAEVAGIQDLPRLQELSMVAQQLPPGQRELVVPRSAFESCAGTLVSLNLSANGLSVIPQPIFGLPRLQRIALAKNQLDSLVDAEDLVSNLEELREVDFRRNPMARDRKFRTAILVACTPILETLDGEPVVPEHREKLVCLAMHRRGCKYGSSTARSGLEPPNRAPDSRPGVAVRSGGFPARSRGRGQETTGGLFGEFLQVKPLPPVERKC